jgi:hypothetical protein
MLWICYRIRDSIVASIPACHAGDRGSIPRRGAYLLFATAAIFHFMFLSLLLSLVFIAQATVAFGLVFELD